MDTAKLTILNALRDFIAQRPGMNPRNYSNPADYLREYRRIHRDKVDAETLLAHVARSGMGPVYLRQALVPGQRLTLTESPTAPPRLEYTTGQYFPTEYRAAAARALASALWNYWRSECMPAPLYRVGPSRLIVGRAHAEEFAANVHATTGAVVAVEEVYPRPHPHGRAGYVSAGEWLRDYARGEFGRGLAARYFN